MQDIWYESQKSIQQFTYFEDSSFFKVFYTINRMEV